MSAQASMTINQFLIVILSKCLRSSNETWLRSLNKQIKPDFMPGGSKAKWFPIYDAIENFIFSSTKKTLILSM